MSLRDLSHAGNGTVLALLHPAGVARARAAAPSPTTDAGLAQQTREVVRLWNELRRQEQALRERSAADGEARLFATRRALQQALARRDRLVARGREPDPAEA
jgi:hypothetical protein